MDIEKFMANGCRSFLVCQLYARPPRYAAFKETTPGGWMWTTDMSEAETFLTKRSAMKHMKGDMAELIDGNGDVKIVKVELKCSIA